MNKSNVLGLFLGSCLLFCTSILSANNNFFDHKITTPKALNTDLRPPDVIHWSPLQARSYSDGYSIVVALLNTEQGFHIYKKRLSFVQKNASPLLDYSFPKPFALKDPISDKDVYVFAEGEFSLLFQNLVPYKQKYFEFSITYLGCTKKLCLFPYTENFKVKNIYVDAPLDQAVKDNILLANKNFARQQKDREKSQVALYKKNPEKKITANTHNLSLWDKLKNPLLLSSWWLLLALFVGGMLTNLTPCVYPMIPITMRLLAAHNNAPAKASFLYALGIVATYTSIGSFAVFTGSLFGAFMANIWVNLFFALIMALLAVTMLGFGNFSALQNFGMKFGGSQKTISALWMGIGAGFVASPCTGPVLASLLTYAASLDNKAKAISLLFVYSSGFALPYIVLGNFTNKLQRLKVPEWLSSGVKFVFAAVMFALMFHYLRIPFYTLYKEFTSLWTELITTSIILTLLLLGLQSFLTEKLKRYFVILPLFMVGLSIFSLSQYISTSRSQKSRRQLTWITEEKAAFVLADRLKSPMIIDMWAEWCAACKDMDATTFSNDKVIAELKKKRWILLKADLTQSSSEQNIALQKRYKVAGLPSLVLIPDSKKPLEFISLKGFQSSGDLLQALKKHAL
jgi:thioredoxin:protein disulfide reductase